MESHISSDRFFWMLIGEKIKLEELGIGWFKQVSIDRTASGWVYSFIHGGSQNYSFKCTIANPTRF